MLKKNFYKNLSVVAGIFGVGMILGHSLGNSTVSTALWIGGLLILAAAVFVGMYISLNSVEGRDSSSDSAKSNTED